MTLDSDASIQLDVSDNYTDIEEPKSPSPSLEDSLQEPLSGESVGISESGQNNYVVNLIYRLHILCMFIFTQCIAICSMHCACVRIIHQLIFDLIC